MPLPGLQIVIAAVSQEARICREKWLIGSYKGSFTESNLFKLGLELTVGTGLPGRQVEVCCSVRGTAGGRSRLTQVGAMDGQEAYLGNLTGKYILSVCCVLGPVLHAEGAVMCTRPCPPSG